jgi:hypothetical protein
MSLVRDFSGGCLRSLGPAHEGMFAAIRLGEADVAYV